MSRVVLLRAISWQHRCSWRVQLERWAAPTREQLLAEYWADNSSIEGTGVAMPDFGLTDWLSTAEDGESFSVEDEMTGTITFTVFSVSTD